MPDDLTKRHPQDGQRINVNQNYELERWSSEFGISTDELIRLVRRVGDRADDVEKEIEKLKLP